jgi:hypothetical protein
MLYLLPSVRDGVLPVRWAHNLLYKNDDNKIRR